MTAKERMLEVLARATGPVCDDCMADKAPLTQRQEAFKMGTDLGSRGVIGRGKATCVFCGKSKNASWSLQRAQVAATYSPPPPSTAAPAQTGERPWYWEGNVQARIIEHLARSGYSIKRAADTASREPGKDIVAAGPDGRELWVSVKGYPENSANVQSRHWFAGAVFDLVLYRGENASVDLALGLPDGYQTYVGLTDRTEWLRRTMPFSIYWVSQSGQVRVTRC